MWLVEVLFAASVIAWVGFTALYIVSGVRRSGSFGMDLRHPISGPFAAYIPVVGILLAAHYATWMPAAAPWLVGTFVGALVIVAGQLVAYWISSGLPQDSLHPGYFLPVIAGSFIASIGLSRVGAQPAAIAAFGVGIFFWLVVGTVIFGRLITGARYPTELVPTMAVLLAPPATGGVAWFLISQGLPNPIQDALAGILIVMLLVQLMLIPQYVKVPFSMTHWAFAFPLAATCNYVIRWMAVLRFPGWQVIAWSTLTIGTAVILAIAARSIGYAVGAQVQAAVLFGDRARPSS